MPVPALQQPQQNKLHRTRHVLPPPLHPPSCHVTFPTTIAIPFQRRPRPQRIHKWFLSLVVTTPNPNAKPNQPSLWEQFQNHAHLSNTHKSKTYFFPTEYYHSCPVITWKRVVCPATKLTSVNADIKAILARGLATDNIMSILARGYFLVYSADRVIRQAEAAIQAVKVPT